MNLPLGLWKKVAMNLKTSNNPKKSCVSATFKCHYFWNNQMIFVVSLMTPECLELVQLLQLLLHRGSVLFLCWNPGTSLGGVPLSGSNSARWFRMLTVSRQDQTLASSSSAWRKGHILISIHKERWIFVYSFSVCASCARSSIISRAEVCCLCSAQLFPEQKWVFTYQKRRDHFFNLDLDQKTLLLIYFS